MTQSWLENIKEGDEILLDSGHYSVSLSKVKVTRVTATQIAIGDVRYRRSDGYRMGPRSGFGSRSQLVKPTPELLEQIRRKQLIDYIADKASAKKMLIIPIEHLESLVTELQKVRLSA
jgi:hypothetical protein